MLIKRQSYPENYQHKRDGCSEEIKHTKQTKIDKNADITMDQSLITSKIGKTCAYNQQINNTYYYHYYFLD